MFNPGELDAIAKRAHEELKSQANQNQAAQVDLYAEFRDDSTQTNNPIQMHKENKPVLNAPTEYIENLNVKNSPDNQYIIDNQPSLIQNMPTEEDLYYEERDEVDPLDTPICHGGPTLSQIGIWKKEWEDYTISLIELLDKYFVFRTLNRFEYKQIIAMGLDQLQNEEMICETCILFPEQFTWQNMIKQEAGLPSTLATIIMEKSGFTKEYAIQVL